MLSEISHVISLSVVFLVTATLSLHNVVIQANGIVFVVPISQHCCLEGIFNPDLGLERANICSE